MSVSNSTAQPGSLSSPIPGRRFEFDNALLLILPAVVLMVAFLIIPLTLLFIIAFNPSLRGIIDPQPSFTLENFKRFFTNSLFYGSLLNSLKLGVFVIIADVIFGYPLAYVIARTTSRRMSTFLTILVLGSMQLDMTVRLYGMITIFGNNNGLVNQTLTALGIGNLTLMHNAIGITLGLVQYTLPFMVFSLVGVIRSIDPTYENAARSLGASRWRAFLQITFPLSLPAVVSGSVLVFALAISSYIVPVILGGSRVSTVSIHLYQQINELGFWQFGSAIGFILFITSLIAILIYYRLTQRYLGGAF